MTKTEWFISIIVGVVIGMIAGLLGVPQLLQAKSVAAASTADEALRATLTSHLKWKTLQGAADVVWYKPDGGTQVYANTFSIQQPNLAQISVKSEDGTGNSGEWISDGRKAYGIDPLTREYAGASLPTFSADLSKLPSTLEAAKTTEVIYRHPFGMLIPSPVGEYLYPQWFSQGGGNYVLAGEETVLGRKVWVVEYTKYTAEVTAWIDEETGVILKYTQKMDGKLFLEVTFTSFEENSPLDASLFTLPADAKPAAQ